MWPEGTLAAWNSGRERQKIAFSCQRKRRVKVSGGRGEALRSPEACIQSPLYAVL